MAEQTNFVKLKDLVGEQFTITRVWGYKWEMWLPGENRMTRSDTYLEGHSKKWDVDTDKGKLSISDHQFGSMLASVFNPKEDTAQLTGMTFKVKSNGKDGMEIRYYINPVYKKSEQAPKPVKDIEDIPDDNEEISLSDIPF